MQINYMSLKLGTLYKPMVLTGNINNDIYVGKSM